MISCNESVLEWLETLGGLIKNLTIKINKKNVSDQNKTTNELMREKK